MATILGASALRRLAQWYLLQGGKTGVPTLNVEAGVQLTHDVGRLIETETPPNDRTRNYLFAIAQQVHVAAGTITETLNPAAFTTALNGYINWVPTTMDLWLLHAWMQVSGTGALFGGATVGVGRSIITMPAFTDGTLTVPPELVATFPTRVTFGDIYGIDVDRPSNEVNFPTQIFQGDLIRFSSNQNAAGTVTATQACLLWIGQKGQRPPGVA